VTAGPYLYRVTIGGGTATLVYDNTVTFYPGMPTGNQDWQLVSLATDSKKVYWTTASHAFPPPLGTALQVCDSGYVYSMPLAGSTPTQINAGQENLSGGWPVNTTGPDRLTSDGKNLYGYRGINDASTGWSAQACNRPDIVMLPVQGGAFTELNAFFITPYVSPLASSDVAADGTHAYWIGDWLNGTTCVTRDDLAACPCQHDQGVGVYSFESGVCPLVDIAGSRIAVDDTYLYIFDDSGTIWRTFK
jgi:hypothetical protein